jgi:5'(3')-deoxyribonucleotidase
LRIGIDLDGVCYSFVDSFRLWAEHTAGRQFGSIECWDFHKEWGFTTPEFLDLMESGCKAGLVFHIGSPMPGSLEGVRAIRAAGHDVVICTTRGDYAHDATHDWLARWGFPYDEVIITAAKGEHNLDVLLDDGPHNIAAIREAGRRGIVFDQPWNRHVTGERVYAWPEFVEMI